MPRQCTCQPVVLDSEEPEAVVRLLTMERLRRGAGEDQRERRRRGGLVWGLGPSLARDWREPQGGGGIDGG